MNRPSRIAAMRGAAGFSIIELMISITLGLVILAALTGFFVTTSANRHEMERNTRQIENGRYAIDTLRDDMVMSGFYADLAPGATPTWQTNAACPANLAALGFAIAPSYTAPVPIFGYADGAGVPACVTDLQAGTDVVVIRRFNSESVTLANAQAGAPSDYPANKQWYVQISECADDDTAYPGQPFFLGDGGGVFPLRKLNCSSIADLWRLREEVYYVRTCSDVCPPPAPPAVTYPTLVRKSVHVSAAGVVVREEPLVEGIQVMRVDYGVDNDGDGLADAWRRCDVATPCAAGDWANVTGAKIYVLSRNLEASAGYVDSKTYSMGLAGSVGPFMDAFKRHVYSAQVNFPNRSGPREPQFSVAP